MSLVQTADLRPDTVLSPLENEQVYCGLDSGVTLEVREALEPQLDSNPLARRIYEFEKSLQGPYLEMMLRGFAVDEIARQRAAQDLHNRLSNLRTNLNLMSAAASGSAVNPNSHKQVAELFYHSLGLPEVWIRDKGVRRLSVNREALEKLDQYMMARPIVQTILRIHDLEKQLQIMEKNIDRDWRWRASYNITGTETGRPSSSKNAFGTGSNAQNIAPGLRYVFIADPGYRLCVIDLEQVEARDVGWFCGTLLNDWDYLDACETGDLHTNNARRIWPERRWTGEPRQDRLLADQQFYREFSYRDMAKRGSHLSNYMGTAWTASRHLKVPIEMMEEFQARYCRGRDADPRRDLPEIVPAFPAIPRFWQWVYQELQTGQLLVTPFGRQRHFFGRPDADETLREAIAFLPQSTTADRMNVGLLRVWRAMPQVELLAQTYDSITFQFREELDEDEVIGRALDLIRVEFVDPGSGRRYTVPGEAKVGWNWGNQSEKNPGGLRKWKRGVCDERTREIGLKRRLM